MVQLLYKRYNIKTVHLSFKSTKDPVKQEFLTISFSIFKIELFFNEATI